jgi:hypothetical protein
MRSRLTSLLLACSLALIGAGVALGGTADITVEGGTYFDFVAPDPLGPTDGTIRFGFTGTVETIAADAELVPPADTNLASLGGGAPTCLEVTREGGVITRLAFVAECVVEGEVTFVDDLFGPGGDAYMIGDRLAAPADFIATNPAFAALIGIPEEAGTVLSVTFTLDMATGIPTSFVGTSTLIGPVTLLDGGDITVDGGTLPTEVIDDASRAALTEASELGVDATVVITGNGSLQVKGPQPELEVVLAVSFTAPAPSVTPVPAASQLPNTSAAEAGSGSAGLGWMLVAAGFLIAGLAAVAARKRA